DWFAPDLAIRLRQAHDPRAQAYLWRRAVIEPPRRIRDGLRLVARLIGRRDENTCKTNNYAVVNEPALAPLALSHSGASQYVDAHPTRVRRIPATLAIQNRNLASQTTLAWTRPSIGRTELVALLGRYRSLYGRWKLSPEEAWARPYVDLMDALMREIRDT